MEVLCIVEFKSYKKIDRIPSLETKQLTKYQTHNLPILLCGRIESVPDIISQVQQIIK